MSMQRRVICVVPAKGLELNARYSVLKETEIRVLVMDDSGNYRWYGKDRFVDPPRMQS